MTLWFPLLVIGAGAAAGAWLRWGLNLWLNPLFPTVPLGTLASNLIGGFFMGVMMGLIEKTPSFPPEVRLAIITGFLGGLTTFSTFSGETVSLFSNEEYFWGSLFVLGNLTRSLGLTVLGMISVKWLS